MARYFRAVVLDFDGTLTTNSERPRLAVLESIRRARAAGYAVILVTGRILRELREVFADFDRHFDAVVAENGAVLSIGEEISILADPVFSGLTDSLRQHRFHVRSGQVLLAGHADMATTALADIHRLGLDCQLIYNRNELMVLPAGITKATGLRQALLELEVSHHNSIAVGDAENDQAMLDCCELGVAVANAVDSLRLRADLVTSQPAGEGVRELLDGPLLGGVNKVYSPRWQVQLGIDPHGESVTVPAAQANLLICGNTGAGKSYLAGLFAERLIAMGYCVLVIDQEGDHQGLARMRDTVRVSAADGLPPPRHVTDMLRQRNTSVILDLAGFIGAARTRYLEELGLQVALQRHAFGLPHWVVTDEAQDQPDSMMPTARIPTQSNWGYALVSWRPEILDAATIEQLDAAIVVGNPVPVSQSARQLAARLSGLSQSAIDLALGNLCSGQAFMAVKPRIGFSGSFTVAARATRHVRHWHKYTSARLGPARWFYFRNEADRMEGTAANLTELQLMLSQCSLSALRHHARGNDISRWIGGVFQDPALANELRALEQDLIAGSRNPQVIRLEMMSAIRRRYVV